MAKSPASTSYFTVLMIGSVLLLCIGLLFTFAPESVPDTLAGTGPLIFLAGVVMGTGYCVVGALSDSVSASAQQPQRIVAGWYPDRTVEGQERYYDGAVWTEHVRQRQS